MLGARRAEEQTSGDLQVIQKKQVWTLMQLKVEAKACNVIGALVMDTWRKTAGRRCQTKETLKEEEKGLGSWEEGKVMKEKVMNEKVMAKRRENVITARSWDTLRKTAGRKEEAKEESQLMKLVKEPKEEGKLASEEFG